MSTSVWQRLRGSFSYLWLVLVAGYLVISAGQAMVRNYQSQQQTDSLQNQLANLQLEKQRLQALLVYYNTDTYKEQVLRQDFLLVMPGEQVYALPESGQPRSLEAEVLQPTTSTNHPKQNAEPSWQQWYNYLFH